MNDVITLTECDGDDLYNILIDDLKDSDLTTFETSLENDTYFYLKSSKDGFCYFPLKEYDLNDNFTHYAVHSSRYEKSNFLENDIYIEFKTLEQLKKYLKTL